MPTSLKKPLRYAIFLIVLIVVVLLINWRIDNNKNEKKKDEKSENNPNQKTPTPPNEDNPPSDNPNDTENWWLTDEEIEHAYQEIRKEIANQSEIQLVSPSEVRVIQEGEEISEDLKKAKYIFFPINNSENHETADTGSHWTLLVFAGGELNAFFNYNSLEFSVTPENAMKVAKNLHEKAKLGTLLHVENVKDIPRQTNTSDCGVYVIAFTRALAKRSQKGNYNAGLKAEELIFTITEERQKLKAAGFPKKGTPGKDYDIGDDVEYLEREEELISQWWPTPGNPFHPLRKNVRATWVMDIEEKGSLYDHADNFKEFSKKVRLLSGKVNQKNTEKAKMAQIYRLKKILKYCSLPLEEYKKTKSFNGKDNFREDKITSEESQFVKENINKEIVKEINDLYNIHFSGK